MVQACGLNEALPLKSFMVLNTIYASIASICCNKFNGIYQRETGTQREVLTEEKRGENNRQTETGRSTPSSLGGVWKRPISLWADLPAMLGVAWLISLPAPLLL